MTRFNSRSHTAKPAVATVTSPMGTVSRQAPDTRTFEGGRGWQKDPRTDLFLRASASFNDGGDKFYETGYQRDAKLRELSRQTAVEDWDWFADFVKWLRRTANIRTAALMIAADGVKARLDAGLQAPVNSVMPTNREVIDSVLYRADEPGELLAYWMHQYGEQASRAKDGIEPSPRIPKPVRKGVSDAVRRLYTQRSLLKYDTASHGVRFGDVLNFCHPERKLPADYLDRLPEHKLEEMTKEDRLIYLEDGLKKLGDLFEYALDRRHNPGAARPAESLHIIRSNANFRKRVTANPRILCDPAELYAAAMTWEDALSLSGTVGVEKREVWEALAPSMGYMALLRNLRNFDEAGLSNKVADTVIKKLTDPEEVAKSRQLPFRFYSAYLNAPSLRWGHALETALDLCLPNIPEFTGDTLVLIDTSASMRDPVSGKSQMQCVQAAALFGAALAVKNPDTVHLHHFASNVERIPVPRGGSVLKVTKEIQRLIGRVGHGTEMAAAIRATYNRHARVILLSDMQAFGGYSRGVAENVPPHIGVYAFNLTGYSASPMPTGSAARFDLGGLSDQTFKLIPLLEQGSSGWPWEVDTISG